MNMTPRQRVQASLNHRQPDRIPIDFGSSFITGIHCSVVAELRRHYGLDERPVKIVEPYQMLGLVEDDLKDAMGIDVTSIFPRKTIFGFPNENWKEFRTPWNQVVLVSDHFRYKVEANGDVYIHPAGDTTAPFSGHMPASSFFFDTIVRQEPYDEDHLNVEDNLEEFGLMTEDDKAYWRREAEALRGTDRAVLTHLGGTCLGDIALVPAPFLPHPRGIRGIEDWYMILVSRPDYVKEIYDRQSAIALKNLETLHGIVGDLLDVVVVCGTDFGTQNSQFCSVETYRELWLPYYKRMNDWIHAHTTWKTFKHSCGAVDPFISPFIESGFDILNPVQCSAEGMEPEHLKRSYGDRITFWGGGVNTQKTLPFGTPDEVRAEVRQRCDIFGPGGGFVFNSIHNIQALTPVENVVAMIEEARRH
ncbi:MAG TPA: uroporphyrinogen decarboxylase family protein [Kiritimatiellia bacterium]|nr:uroporphyrinogen decarboxylase family protein [Kiritimatiellia bacterium]